MHKFELRLISKSLKKNLKRVVSVNPFIQPFVQVPSASTSEEEYIDRMSAHDLFSHYTVEILKDDIVYAR